MMDATAMPHYKHISTLYKLSGQNMTKNTDTIKVLPGRILVQMWQWRV
jgi:hypothetical protein